MPLLTSPYLSQSTGIPLDAGEEKISRNKNTDFTGFPGIRKTLLFPVSRGIRVEASLILVGWFLSCVEPLRAIAFHVRRRSHAHENCIGLHHCRHIDVVVAGLGKVKFRTQVGSWSRNHDDPQRVPEARANLFILDDDHRASNKLRAQPCRTCNLLVAVSSMYAFFRGTGRNEEANESTKGHGKLRAGRRTTRKVHAHVTVLVVRKETVGQD